MPEQSEYFDKFLAEKFQHIDESVKQIDQKVERIIEDNQTFKKEIRVEIKTEIDEIKSDNKNTRRWIFGTVVGTGLTVLLGLAALLLTFVQIQNSWMQQVISFVSKMIVK